jgi:prophage antirepressor-like protein
MDAENIQADFSINEWFNDLPIRIVGSHEEPFFYANDLAAILGIVKVRNSVKNFTEKDIVTPEQREKYGIKTYRILRGKMVEESSIILLTEYGAYRLIMRSNSEKAEELRNFIIDSIRRLRLTENMKLRTVNEKLIAENTDLKTKEKYNDEIKERLEKLEVYRQIVK